jgi:diguanylate cyclase (GGDEF)-like protein
MISAGSCENTHSKVLTIQNVNTTPNATPRPISRVTVAIMVHLCEYMFQRRGPMREPLFDISKIPVTLFAMGFERDFLSKCENRYYWNFASLFPALYDGSFYDNTAYGQARGQGDLRGFATFLCGAFADTPKFRTALNDSFEQSLLADGYRFVRRKLVETGVDVSTTPELAALPNKESLLQDLSLQLQSDELIAVLFVDLDHFKQVNDQLEHAGGDNCLSAVVQTIARVLRHKGKLYRVGGDEFCAMLPNSSNSEAAATAERVRAAIDALKPFGGVVKVTASIGVAVSDRKELSTPEALVKAADNAMYVSKFTTMNRICSWPPDAAEAAEAEANRKKAAQAAARTAR